MYARTRESPRAARKIAALAKSTIIEGSAAVAAALTLRVMRACACIYVRACVRAFVRAYLRVHIPACTNARVVVHVDVRCIRFSEEFFPRSYTGWRAVVGVVAFRTIIRLNDDDYGRFERIVSLPLSLSLSHGRRSANDFAADVGLRTVITCAVLKN